MREAVGGKGGWERRLCCPVPWSHSGCEFFFFFLHADGVKNPRRENVWGCLQLRFSWSWRCLCLQVPVAASLEAHQKAAPLPPQQLLLLGYRLGQGIATANKACRLLKSAQCQLSQSERVKYGYWKLHWAALGLIFHLMFACNMVQYWTAVL